MTPGEALWLGYPVAHVVAHEEHLRELRRNQQRAAILRSISRDRTTNS